MDLGDQEWKGDQETAEVETGFKRGNQNKNMELLLCHKKNRLVIVIEQLDSGHKTYILTKWTRSVDETSKN